MMRGLVLVSGLVMAVFAWAQPLLINALVEGQVVKQSVSEGAQVRKGQLLLVIDPEGWKARERALQAAVMARKAELEDARLDLDEARDLFDRTVLSKRALQRAEKKHALARARLTQAQAELAQHRALKKYHYVRAPVSGQVQDLRVQPGSIVFKGSPLMALEVSE